jgi:hypothetical protein
MFIDFQELPEESRVWIYQANRTFKEEELEILKPQLQAFLEKWTAHGQNLKAGFEMPYDRFIVIGLDQAEAGATGCSIDASVHFIQAVEKEFDIDLMDKMNVSFKNGPYVAYKELIDFRKMAKAKSVTSKTIVFNNLVQTVGEYKDYWEVPASESWHSRFF